MQTTHDYTWFFTTFKTVSEVPNEILLGDFHAKFGRKGIFKLTVGNESLREDSNDNFVRVLNFTTSKLEGAYSTYRKEERCIQVLVRKTGTKTPPGRPGRRRVKI